MTRNKSSWIRFATLAAIIILTAVTARWAYAKGETRHVHLTSDWSNRHMIYSEPGTINRAWKVQSQLRYGHQLLRRLERDGRRDNGHDRNRGKGKKGDSLRVDWGMSLLPAGTNGAEMFPAKFSFDVTAAPDCVNDFVVYNTGLAGATGVDASQTGNFTNNTATDGQTIIVANGANSITLTASTTVNTGLNFQVVNTGSAPADEATDATNLAAAIQRNGFNVPVFSFSSGPTVTVGASIPGTLGNSTTLSSTVSGFAWNGATLTGGQGSASIIAFNELYSSQGTTGGQCNQNGPSVMWSYATGSNPVVTSPVISGDGKEIAYVENPTGAAAILHILRWQPGEGNSISNAFSPDITLTAGQNWTNCPNGASCIMNITFSGTSASTDSNSSPFYDYNTDILYVGDNNGHLHKFTGVFLGAPAEVTSSPWPIAVHGADFMSSPVFDGVSGNIFLGDDGGRLSYVMESGSVTGSCAAGTGPGGTSVPPCLGATNVQVGNGGAIVDAPIVDGTNGTVFAFNGTETFNNGSVLQTNTSLTGTPGGGNVLVNVGGTGTGSYIHAGSFDDSYFNSAQGATTGHLYVCGKDPASTDRPAVFQLSFAANGTLNSSPGTPLVNLVSNDGEACSPISEIENPNAAGGAKEWIFFSVGNLANNAGVSNSIPAGPCRTNNAGCIVSIDITALGGAGAWNTFASANGPVSNAVAVPAGPATGPAGGRIDSTSGIIVDNIGADPSAVLQVSSIYFALTANSTGAGPGLPSCNTTSGVGCAIKLTQAALQ